MTSTASRSSRANPASENLDTDNWTGQADPERAKASAEKLKAIAAREGATMIYGHDPAVWAGLRLAPAYYE